MPKGVYPRVARSVADRFWEKVERRGADECWPWRGGQQNGYGSFAIKASNPCKVIKASRACFMIAHAIKHLPTALQVCHRCDNPICVNPAHLFLGTMLDNTRDMWTKGRGRNVHIENLRARSHCLRGHPLSGDNLYVYGGSRTCKACRALASRRHARRKSA